MHGTIQHMPSDVAHLDERSSREEAEAAVRRLVRWAGDSSMREGLVETPARARQEFLSAIALPEA